MKIFVKDLLGKTRPIECEKKTSIFEFKGLIFSQEGPPVAAQQIISQGRILGDDRSLGDYNINENDTVHMTLKLTGD